MSPFPQTLSNSWQRHQSLLCVGLDPNVEKLPPTVRRGKTPIFTFNREIIDATAPSVCAFKPQIACYAAVAAEAELEQTIGHIKQHHPHILVILDAKRGDIGVTAEMYAREAFERYGADAVTVNPYLGGDSLAPFLARADKGVFVLCRTSNPGSGDFQTLESDGISLAHQVAKRAAGEWNAHGNVGLVVGATWHEEIAAVRQLAPQLPLLIPGIGAQGGDLQAVVKSGVTADKNGLIINVSRSVIYAGYEDEIWHGDFAQAAQQAAAGFCADINEARH